MTKITEGHAWAELTVQPPTSRTLIGSVHGGILMTFADVVAAAAAWPYGSHITTQECSIHFLNAAIHVDKLLAEGIGRSTKTDFRRPEWNHRPDWPEKFHLYLQPVNLGKPLKV